MLGKSVRKLFQRCLSRLQCLHRPGDRGSHLLRGPRHALAGLDQRRRGACTARAV
jgi:hypothetical protein